VDGEPLLTRFHRPPLGISTRTALSLPPFHRVSRNASRPRAHASSRRLARTVLEVRDGDAHRRQQGCDLIGYRTDRFCCTMPDCQHPMRGNARCGVITVPG
jgi:hypothetical protein